jgi:hypothetical protein
LLPHGLIILCQPQCGYNSDKAIVGQALACDDPGKGKKAVVLGVYDLPAPEL